MTTKRRLSDRTFAEKNIQKIRNDMEKNTKQKLTQCRRKIMNKTKDKNIVKCDSGMPWRSTDDRRRCEKICSVKFWM